MTIKVFFDMDGVLVNFSAGVAAELNKVIETNDTSTKAFKRLVNYEGPDREPITIPFLEASVTKKDLQAEKTQWEKRVTRALFKIVTDGGHDYWSTLPSNPGYLDMINKAIDLVGIENVYICTAPVFDETGGCESGKRAWVQSNTPVSNEHVFVTTDKGGIASKFPDDICILIDDRIKYCTAWESSGGISIRHEPPADIKRVQQTISQLSYLVNEHSARVG